MYFDWSALGTTPWNAGAVSVIAVSFQTLPSSSAGVPGPGGNEGGPLKWGLEGRACSGPNVIVPPSVNVIVSVSFVPT